MSQILEYRAQVGYEPVPSLEELALVFRGGVSELFGKRTWQNTLGVEPDTRPGERLFRAQYLPEHTNLFSLILLSMRGGYRPATHMEALALVRSSGQALMLGCEALGSFVLDETGVPSFASFAGGQRGRDFALTQTYDRLDGFSRTKNPILFVQQSK